MTMFIAADTAFELGRLEDAAFLLHAARFRAMIDRDRFPAKQQGSESPGIYLGFLSENAGQVIGPAALQKPDAMLAASRRFAAWDYGTIKSYDPGWEHSGPTAAPETYKARHDEMGRALVSQAELMQDSEYAALVTSMSAFAAKHFFETLGQDDTNQNARVTYERDFRRMVEIETTKGVKGFSPVLLPDLVFRKQQPLPPSHAFRDRNSEDGNSSPGLSTVGSTVSLPAPSAPWPALTLSGVLGSVSGGSCIINGRVFSAGDMIEGVRVVDITKNGVLAEFRGERRVLTIKGRQ
ncbi:MAG: hypothetical protein ACOYOU_19935 [Kiritimatiellia bacterium]